MPEPATALERRLERRQRCFDRLHRHLLVGPADPAYRWLIVAWTVAVAARLTLAESLEPAWRAPSWLLGLGALGLLVWGGRVFWLLTTVGLTVPLFFLRDWLTQSVILLLIAAVGLITAHRPAADTTEAHAAVAAPLLATARRIVLATYVVAAFHKLNADFFDPSVSCATDLLRQLGAALPILAALPIPSGQLLPAVAIVAELAVPALLLWRPRLGVAVGALFHLPLTLVFAPAFAFVMGVGYVALLGPADRVAIATTVRRAWPWLLGTCGLGVALLVAAMSEPPLIDLVLKLALIAFVAMTAAAVIARHGLGTRPIRLPLRGLRRLVVLLAVLVFVVNGATPYLGTQVQHTGAMLSNLRVDAGCWNHWVVPEGVRVVDAYIRFDDVRIGAVGNDPSEEPGALEQLLVSRLWSTTALRQMRRNWCSERLRPLVLRGTYLGEPLAIADLCNEAEPLPVGPGVWWLPELFPDYLRFQKGLLRACPQVCLH